MTDEKILFKAIRSNKREVIDETFNYIYDKYKSLVVFIAAKYIKSPEDIQDIVQETFIDFFKNAENIHTSIKGYLSTACKHNSFNFLKKNKRIDFVDDQELDLILDDCDEQKQRDIANDAFNELIDDMKKHLSETELNIILLYLVYDYKFDDIALKLNQNVNTIKTKYYRALKIYKQKKGDKQHEKK